MQVEIIQVGDSTRRTQRLAQVSARTIALDSELLRTVENIINTVRVGGDAALLELTARFDNIKLTQADLRVPRSTLETAAATAAPELVAALRAAIQQVREFHMRQLPQDWEMQSAAGARLGQRVTPIERAGLYVPGGSASYPSSVIMNVVPAQVAGVKRIVVTTPPRALQQSPAVAAVLLELGVSEVYAIGGAQAIAALAFGTETVPKVDKITGPGNRYVAAAKKLVFGAVGIDSIAGPTEIVIIADRTAPPRFVAADMLAQAEHDPDAAALLLTNDPMLAAAVQQELEIQLTDLPRAEIARAALQNFGAIIVVDELHEACEIADQLAPEHLEIICGNARELAARVANAGAIFIGPYAPEATGDYIAGPNHVLPTAGAARFSSALSVYDFVKFTSIIEYSQPALREQADAICLLARAEGLEAHARSVLCRLEQ